ncbi:MAG: hypothetical protein JNK04_21040, partial [Myxococcales bacterium]|nr:hypothetical protein [Myxococcales bacterium]
MSVEPTPVERAAWALRRGDPLAVLTLTQGVEHHVALAIRGAALAQLEEHADAMKHLERAAAVASEVGDVDTLARASLALAEVQIAERDLSGASRRLDACRGALRAQPANSVLAAVLGARVALLRGEHSAASALLSAVEETEDSFLGAVLRLSRAELLLASGKVDAANAALAEARVLAARSRHAFLMAEIDAGVSRLSQPVARLRKGGEEAALSSLELARVRHGAAGILDTLRASFA